MTISILHRATGVAMSIGLIVLAVWLFSVSNGVTDYERIVAAMSSMPGRWLLIGWSFSFFLHLANGVRHLVWDFGHGFEKKQADASAWFVLLLAIALTSAFWLLS